MSNNDGYIISCSRCGAELNSNSRYCMKCGNLNPDHPDNKYMKKYIDKSDNSYVVGSGKNLTADISGNVGTVVGRNTGNFNLCFLLNMFVYILIVGIASFYYFSMFDGDIALMCTSGLYIIYISISSMFLWIFGNELVFMKLNQKWWYSLIPIYNNMVLSKCVFNNKWLGLIILVPVIGPLFYLILIYKLAKEFKKSGILMILFPMIMFLVIGYGSSSFNNKQYVSSDNSTLENEFAKKKLFLIISMFFLFIGIGMVVYNNFSTLKNESKTKSSQAYLYYVSKVVMKKAKNNYSNKKYECYTDSEILYFYSPEADADYFLPFAVFYKPVKVYVKVVKNGSDVSYYMSMSDGEFGFEETLFEDISVNTIVKYNEFNEITVGLCSYK